MTSAEFQRKNPDYAHTNDRTIVIKELDGGVRLLIDLSDHVIGLGILRGRYEQEEVAFVRSLLKPGDTAIDAGAHIGFFTMHMAAAVGAAGMVYAFEPVESNVKLLERSVAENRFGERVFVRRAAVGASTGSATLTFPVETLNSGGAYLLRDGTAPLAGNQTMTVSTVSLDDLDLSRPIRLIKMDVEGAEPLIIAGAARLLKDDRPTILSEIHPTQLERASGLTADQFVANLHAFGYRAYIIESGAIGAPLEHAPASALTSVVFLPR